jgi:hypothetical protein
MNYLHPLLILKNNIMATIGRNIVTTGFKGKVGDLIVFRTRGNKTYVSESPKITAHELSPKQKAALKRFQEAVIYGKGCMADAVTKAAYQNGVEGNQSAYNVAVADFLNAPQIDEVDLSTYKGQVGNTIRVRATDDFKVTQVTLAIYNSDNTLVEEGKAVQAADLADWVYTVTKENTNLTGDKIIVKASDLPGNITESDQMI